MSKFNEVEAPVLDEAELIAYIEEKSGIRKEVAQQILDLEMLFMEEKGFIQEEQALGFYEPEGYIQLATREFHELFKHPIADQPTVMPINRAVDRMKWTMEECIEFVAASSKSREEFAASYYALLDGLQAVYKNLLDGEFNHTPEDRIVAQVDALADQAYFMGGTSVELGIDLDEVVGIVHQANLSKLFVDEDGNLYPKYREDGKVMKSPNFKTPERNLKAYIASL